MNYRGFLKDSGGAKRLRFVMPGYDAGDENVPPNKVIFDSNSVANVSILRRGSWFCAGRPANQMTDQVFTLATWDLDFVPLCHHQFEWAAPGRLWEWTSLRAGGPYPNFSGYNPDLNYIQATRNGLYIKYAGSPAFDVTLHWTAYNLAVA